MTPAAIRRLRKRMGWSQETLARKLDVSTPTVRWWEYGRNKPCQPNKEKLKALLDSCR